MRYVVISSSINKFIIFARIEEEVSYRTSIWKEEGKINVKVKKKSLTMTSNVSTTMDGWMSPPWNWDIRGVIMHTTIEWKIDIEWLTQIKGGAYLLTKCYPYSCIFAFNMANYKAKSVSNRLEGDLMVCMISSWTYECINDEAI